MNHAATEYIARLLSPLHAPPAIAPAATMGADDLAAEVFSILTSREFCPLGRTRAEPYRAAAVALLLQNVEAGQPARFYYDIGPGYHASIDAEQFELVFDTGFSELCILAQIAAFCNRVREVYAPGAHFHLVVDNVCGLVTNDIPLENTVLYCARLRSLISETKMNDRVAVLVESEAFDAGEYQVDLKRLAADTGALAPTAADIENVHRFLGRACDEREAAERIARYAQAGEMTEAHLAGVVDGVRMTQRATPLTLGFRPFPGGDSRTQVGELAISPNNKGGFRPILLTSRNASAYRRTRLSLPNLLPPRVPFVTLAEPVLQEKQA
jgi:hypothetical protein